MDKVSTTTTYVSAAGAIVFGLTANELIALGGLLVSMAAFVFTVVIKTRNSSLEKKKLAAELELLGLEITKLKGARSVQTKSRVTKKA